MSTQRLLGWRTSSYRGPPFASVRTAPPGFASSRSSSARARSGSPSSIRRIERVLSREPEREPAESVQPMLTSVTGQPPAGPAFKRGGSAEPTFSGHELCARLEGVRPSDCGRDSPHP